MMGEGAFILLKTGRCEPEREKQDQGRIANLYKILSVAPRRREK
jgi:hypothetical protein